MSDTAKIPGSPANPGWLWLVLTVLIPIVVTAIVQMSGIFHKGRELDIKTVELGVGILRAGPQETGSRAAREWAVNVIERYSGVPFSAEARKELLNNSLSVVITPQISGIGTVSGGDSSSVGGWAAIGFVGSRETADLNFTLVGGEPITSAALKPGTIVKAKTSINLRPGPANWSAINFVLNPGQCLAVSETRELRAGERNQTWARGDISQCR